MRNARTLWVIGDPIIDQYIEGALTMAKDPECLFFKPPGPRMSVSKVTQRPGGASNTHVNAMNMAHGFTSITIDAVWTSMFGSFTPTLTRIVDPTTKKIQVEFWDVPDSQKDKCMEPEFTMMWDILEDEFGYPTFGPHAAIVSDYNKGVVNRPPAGSFIGQTIERPWKFILVDSRYRTFDFDIASCAETRIWHATGDEYDEDWAQNFDWVLWTNGPEDVKIIEVRGTGLKTVQVPDTKVVDTTGAGDTFTAAVGVYLIHRDGIVDIDSLTEATKFGVACAQTVITEKYTTTSKLTLEEYLCTSQIPTRSSHSSE
jgi:bifunctional ADP-heptose synthase (sugar kinase/adenylyltransferase)